MERSVKLINVSHVEKLTEPHVVVLKDRHGKVLAQGSISNLDDYWKLLRRAEEVLRTRAVSGYSDSNF